MTALRPAEPQRERPFRSRWTNMSPFGSSTWKNGPTRSAPGKWAFPARQLPRSTNAHALNWQTVVRDGRPLQITGGHYRLCDGTARCCGAPCRKSAAAPVRTKGANSMRIAVTYENGNVFQHFGHTAYFKLYDVENGAVTAAQVIGTDGSGHGALRGPSGRAAGGRADLRRHRRRRADGLEQRWHPPVCRRFRQRRRGRAGPVKRHAACRRPIQLQPPRPHLCAAFLQRRQAWLFRQLNLSF